MIKRILTFILITSIFQNIFSQKKVCTSNKDNNYEDLNEIIIDKCTAKEKKINAKKFIVKERKLIKNRFNKKRKIIQVKNLPKKIAINNIKNGINNLILSIGETKKIVSIKGVDKIPSFISDKDNNTFEKFNVKISDHINNHLTYSTSNIIHKLKGIVKVSFIIDTEGEVKSIKATCNNSNILEKEVIRIISLLPRFIPGKYKGKKVNVFYNFHISFN
ncbi:energy transducer TonB [Tenacibaculum dicentrarchi]|uniref:energy transducer TonB n=1 Tax=Tenacibaculum dicentrarchi TaxID=669041 RepID=UPI003510E02E